VVIATLRRDSRPLSTATWYLRDDGRVPVNTDEGRKRLEHIRHDPRITLDLLDESDWYTHVSITGHVQDLPEDTDLADIDRLARQYTGRAHPRRDRRGISAWITMDGWHRHGALKNSSQPGQADVCPLLNSRNRVICARRKACHVQSRTALNRVRSLALSSRCNALSRSPATASTRDPPFWSLAPGRRNSRLAAREWVFCCCPFGSAPVLLRPCLPWAARGQVAALRQARPRSPAGSWHHVAMTSSRQLVSSGSPLEPEIGLSRAVRSGSYVCVAGTAPIAEGGGVAAPGDVYGQSVRCLDIAEQALQEAGASVADVVRTRVMLTDIGQWRDAARAHAQRFAQVRPACTFVEVSRFIDPGWLVEFELDAIILD
jgi:PPOX class probable F420-dependent enzyme